MDKAKIDQFWQARTKVSDARIATNYRDDGRLQIDCDFVRRFIFNEARILDLGAGTCTLTSQLLPYCREATAVEKFAEFLDKAPVSSKLTKICCDVVSFQSQESFDAILLFGVANFLTPDEESELYANCCRMLSGRGTFLVKNQCGVDREIVVDKHSDELGCHYHARYPFVQDQKDRLDRHFVTTVVDIYPAHINRWSDTHFYGFVCECK
ncbi:MAG: class I SAM-dependent methyltransferase [Pirellula sp.]